MAEDLGRFLEGMPVRACPVGVAERAAKWLRRRPAAALLIAGFLVASAAAAGTGIWLQQQEANHRLERTRRESKARDAIGAALRRTNELRDAERWHEASLILTEASARIAEADSPPLQEELRQSQSDVRIAIDLEFVRENRPHDTRGAVDYGQWAAKFQAAFDRAGLAPDSDEGSVATIRSSAIREQIVAALDDRAFVAHMIGDGLLATRLSQIAKSADPEPHWRDRFRDPAAWKSRDRLRELADAVFTTSPPPAAHQLALLSMLLRQNAAGDRSTELLTEACRRQPANFWLNREMGTALFNESQFHESVGYFRATMAVRPKNPASHEQLGTALIRVGRTEAGLAAYRRAIELAPGAKSSAHSGLVRALAEAGYWRDAEEECRRARELDPTNPAPLYHLATASTHRHRAEDAIVFFRKAIEIRPNDFNLNRSLGMLYHRMNRHDEAAAALRNALASIPQSHSIPLRRDLVNELIAAGRTDEALAETRAAMALAPDDAGLHLTLATVFRSQGYLDEADTEIRKCLQSRPLLPKMWNVMAAIQLDRGNFAEARAAAQRLFNLSDSGHQRRAWNRQLELCNALLAVDSRLPAILAGEDQAIDAATQCAVAEWCLEHKCRPAKAAGFYSLALSARPALAADREARVRYSAARAAALAGCGVGDGAPLDAQRRTVLRKQALDWLSAEYAVWADLHRRGKSGDRTAAATAVRDWQRDNDLSGVRDELAVSELPPDERRDWRELWSKVAELAARDPVQLIRQARSHGDRREWAESAACYGEAMKLEPTGDGEVWFEYAASQLLAGDQAGYRKACAHMLAECQSATQMRPYLAARACTLAPGAVEDPSVPARVAMNELANNYQAFWSLTERGALEIRIGRVREAVPHLERSLAVDGRPGTSVLNWLWLAQVHQRLGNSAEARRWRDKAARWLDQQGGRMPLDTQETGSHRHTWLEAHVLRQEVENVLR